MQRCPGILCPVDEGPERGGSRISHHALGRQRHCGLPSSAQHHTPWRHKDTTQSCCEDGPSRPLNYRPILPESWPPCWARRLAARRCIKRVRKEEPGHSCTSSQQALPAVRDGPARPLTVWSNELRFMPSKHGRYGEREMGSRCTRTQARRVRGAAVTRAAAADTDVGMGVGCCTVNSSERQAALATRAVSVNPCRLGLVLIVELSRGWRDGAWRAR